MFEHRWLDREQFSSLASRVFKYSLATIGPVGAAGAQFILSLQMLHTLTPREFGSFSFLLVALQFSCGIWSALFCSPLPAVVTTKTDAEKLEMLRCLFSANAAGAAIASLLFALLGLSLGLPTWGIVLFALYAAATLLRWFARQHAYLVGNMPRTVLSDTLYSVCLFSGIALIRFLNLRISRRSLRNPLREHGVQFGAFWRPISGATIHGDFAPLSAPIRRDLERLFELVAGRSGQHRGDRQCPRLPCHIFLWAIGFRAVVSQFSSDPTGRHSHDGPDRF